MNHINHSKIPMSEPKNKLPIIDRYGGPLIYSHSKLNNFNNCPRQFWHTTINGDATQKWTTTPEKAYGNKMHKHLENALLTRSPDLHPEAANDPAMVRIYNGVMKSLTMLEKKFICKAMLCPEMSIACDVKFNASPYYTDPKHKERNLLIGKADIVIMCPEDSGGDVALIYDLKTGNPAWSSPDQLNRMALLTFINHPWINRIKSAYLWTKDGGRPEWYQHTRDGLDAMKKAIIYETGQVELCHVSGSWPAKSSGLCKFCPVKQFQCEHKR